LDHAVQKLPGAPHKWQALLVFVGPRTLSHKHQFGVRIPFPENYVVAAAGELTAPAIPQVRADLLERFGPSRLWRWRFEKTQGGRGRPDWRRDNYGLGNPGTQWRNRRCNSDNWLGFN